MGKRSTSRVTPMTPMAISAVIAIIRVTFLTWPMWKSPAHWHLMLWLFPSHVADAHAPVGEPCCHEQQIRKPVQVDDYGRVDLFVLCQRDCRGLGASCHAPAYVEHRPRAAAAGQDKESDWGQLFFEPV